MSTTDAREAKILNGYRRIFNAPEVASRRYKNGAIVLLVAAVVVASVSGHLVAEKAQYNAGQLLAILSGILIGLSFMLFANSGQVLAFSKFCTLKKQFQEEPIQPPHTTTGSSAPDRV